MHRHRDRRALVRLLGLLAALASSTAFAGWTRLDWAPTAGVTGIRSGCVAAGQYERPIVPISGSSAGNVTINGLPDSGRCYFALNGGAQDEWHFDFTALTGGRMAPGSVRNLNVVATATPPPPPPPPPPTSLVSEVSRPYELGTMAVGQRAYTDQTWTFSWVNTLANGATLIRMPSTNATVTFRLNAAATVYVGWDESQARPAWLSGYTLTQGTLVANGQLRIYTRVYQPGLITLGPNTSATAQAYLVGVRAQ